MAMYIYTYYYDLSTILEPFDVMMAAIQRRPFYADGDSVSEKIQFCWLYNWHSKNASNMKVGGTCFFVLRESVP